MTRSTRDALIDAAAQLLDMGGPSAVTLRAVGEAAGVSHNAPYRHFSDKAALLAAVAARELTAFGSDLSAPPAIETLMSGYVRWALHRPERFKLTFGRWERDDGALAETANASRRALLEAVQRAQTAGRMPPSDPERLAALLLATAHGAADLALSGHLAREGKWGAGPEDLLADLFGLLSLSATAAAR